MFEKIKKYQKHPYIQQFQDTRALALVLFGVVAVIVTWSGIKAVQTNYALQKQISRLQQENQVHELESNNLKLKNQYLETDQFLELSARRQFGKAAPGEKLILVPKRVALSRTVDLPDPKPVEEQQSVVAKPTYQKNFQAWIDFFLHRQNTEE